MEKELKEMIEKLEKTQNEMSKVSINLSQMRAWIQTYISIQDGEKVGHLNDAWNLIDWVSEHYPNVYNEYVEKHPDSVWKKH